VTEPPNIEAALARLREAIARTRRKYVEGTPEQYPLTVLDYLTVLEAEAIASELERLRIGYEKEGNLACDEALRRKAAEDQRDETLRMADGMARAPYGEFQKLRQRAETAEAELERMRAENERLNSGVWVRPNHPAADNERAAIQARLGRAVEALREITRVASLPNFPEGVDGDAIIAIASAALAEIEESG
jgi:hypothetical protein